MKNTGTEGAEGWLKGQRSYRSLPPPGHHPTAATYGCSLFAESRVDLTASRLLSRWRESTLESTSKSPGRESTPPVQASIREVPSVKELTAHHVDVHFLISRAMIGFFPTAIYLIHLKLFKTSPWVCVCVSECVSPFKSIDTNRKKKKKNFKSEEICNTGLLPSEYALSGYINSVAFRCQLVLQFIYLFISQCVCYSKRAIWLRL